MTQSGSAETTAATAPFGTRFVPRMSVARWRSGEWTDAALEPVAALALHPAAHVLHYGSACFEGLKAHRGTDGTVRVFRLDRHVERLRASAASLLLPVPPTDLTRAMVLDTVRDALDEVPASPGSLYLRPTLIGTEANIGAAAHPTDEALLFILASPVGDYFAGGVRPLTVAVETEALRTTPQFGTVKTGANYAMALGAVVRAAADVGADQVLFAPGGQVQETGASNVLLLDGERIVTPALTSGFLHGVTRDSLLHIAADLGLAVEERDLHVDEVMAWAARPDGEAALSGTAAVLAPVGTFVRDGGRVRVGTGGAGPATIALRDALLAAQRGERAVPEGWLTEVS